MNLIVRNHALIDANGGFRHDRPVIAEVTSAR